MPAARGTSSSDAGKAPHGTPKQRRWGLWTLAFLTLAFVMIVLSSTAGHYTVITLLGLLVGLAGAAWCSVKGLRKAKDFRLP